jgi:hypothetical protein
VTPCSWCGSLAIVTMGTLWGGEARHEVTSLVDCTMVLRCKMANGEEKCSFALVPGLCRAQGWGRVEHVGGAWSVGTS